MEKSTVKKIALIASTLALSACGSDSRPLPALPTCDVPQGQEGSLATTPMGTGTALVLTMALDYSSSAISGFHVDSPAAIDDEVVLAGNTPKLRRVGSYAVVVNGGVESNIQLVGGDFTAGPQIAMPDCGPEDVELLAANLALVSCYDKAALQLVDFADARATCEVDISAFADADGIPEASAMTRIGDYIYVALQRLDRNGFYAPAGPGLIAVLEASTLNLLDVDPNTDGVQAYSLPCSNPFTDLLPDADGNIIVGCAGDWVDLGKAGVAKLDPNTGETTLIASGTDLGGQPMYVRLDGHGEPYVVVTEQDLASATFDIKESRVVRLSSTPEVVFQVAKANIGGLAFDSNGNLYVGSRAADSSAGLYVIEAGKAPAGPYVPSLPPLEIEVF